MINGEGIRVSIFVSGCNHYCKGCFNHDAWNPCYGEKFSEKIENDILSYFEKYNKSIQGLSLLGGDPTYKDNLKPLKKFLMRFKRKFTNKDIWIWSGFVWEVIKKDKDLFSLIELCDVLIDGKFQIEKKDLTLKWRGSRNQRVIDIKKSIKTGQLIKYLD